MPAGRQPVDRRRFAVRPFYTLGELARMCGISKGRLRRALEHQGVRVTRSGGVLLVLLVDLKTDWPEFWLSLQAAGSESASD